MAIIGEQIKSLMRDAPAKADVLLCAPFIKAPVLNALLSNIGAGAKLRVFTRWNAWEVAAGVSDLEVFDLCNDRPGTQLYLVDNLHAKAYIAGERALIGSANLTATALGWSEQPNIEILTEISSTSKELSGLIFVLERNARQATLREKEKISEEANSLTLPASPESSLNHILEFPWLPRCAAPEQLYEVYSGQSDASLLGSTITDAQQDLRDLALARNMNEEEFGIEIKTRLLGLSTFREIADKANGQINDQSGKELMRSFNSELDDRDALMLWAIVRTWIEHFFDEFEVVANDHVIRKKSRSEV